MKTIADLTVKELSTLAQIALLQVGPRVIFMADSPKETFRGVLKPTLTPYALRTLVKLVPDLNLGRTPVITSTDTAGVALVKATWCGIRQYGLQDFFIMSSMSGKPGSFKKDYLLDSVAKPASSYDLTAIDLYVELLEWVYASQVRSAEASKDKLVKSQHHPIGDYWDNACARRHLGKDMRNWDKHVQLHKGEAHA